MREVINTNHLGLLAAKLQHDFVDYHHINKLNRLREKSSQLNEELRQLIYPILHKLQQIQNNPDLRDQPVDFREFEAHIEHFEQIYRDYKDELQNTFPEMYEEIKQDDLINNLHNLIENIEAVTVDERALMLAKCQELEKHHNDEIDQIANTVLVMMQMNTMIAKIMQRALEGHQASTRYIIQNYR